MVYINKPNIHSISFRQLLLFINSLRIKLLDDGFQEVILTALTDYYVTNSNSVKIADSTYLRDRTEPEVWDKNSDLDKFYCVTTLHRLEDPKSQIHKEEFHVADIYLNTPSDDQIINYFFDLLSEVERKLLLPKLCSLPRVFIDFDDFQKQLFDGSKPSIIIVENYPIEDSFYDQIVKHPNRTSKAEVFLSAQKVILEFGVLGRVGPNLNATSKVVGYQVNSNPASLNNLRGFCYGLERTLLAHSLIEQL